MKTLILFAHTFWENSKVNKALLESVQGLPNLTIENLTLTCPNATIDVNAQKSLLKDADTIIFQFPLFWFSTPSLLKEWQDRVFEGIIEQSGRDHIIMSNPQTGEWYLVLMIYLDFVTFEEPINYKKQYYLQQ